MVRIITDSTSDLPPDLTDKHQIEVVPLSVEIGGRTYLDQIEMTQARLFQLVDQVGELPKTAAPSPGLFESTFAGSEEIVFIGISSQLSATVQNAHIGADAVDGERVRIIDSLNLSTAAGLLVLEAADLRDQGLSAAEIERALLPQVPKLRCMFVIDTLRYLYMGGRLSAMENLVGSVLRVRPVIEICPDGTMGVKTKIRGSRQRTIQVMLDQLQADAPQVDRRRVFITHTSPEDARQVAEEIRRIADPDEVLLADAGSVVSSHCGPGALGILYKLR